MSRRKTSEMERVTFNANDYVYVKLTEKGLRILREQDARLRKLWPQLPPYREPLPDERGFFRCQLWELMQNFGPHMGMGLNNCFDMDIEFDKSDLKGSK